MSEKFEKDILNIVQKKLSQAKAVAIVAAVSEKYPSEQLIMFVYDKLQQEEFVSNGSPLTPFIPAKKASVYMLPGGKNEDK